MNESALAEVQWLGQYMCDRLFSLAEQPEFRGSTPGSVRLPPVDQSVSRTPICLPYLAKAYPHGLEFAEESDFSVSAGKAEGEEAGGKRAEDKPKAAEDEKINISQSVIGLMSRFTGLSAKVQLFEDEHASQPFVIESLESTE